MPTTWTGGNNNFILFYAKYVKYAYYKFIISPFYKYQDPHQCIHYILNVKVVVPEPVKLDSLGSAAADIKARSHYYIYVIFCILHVIILFSLQGCSRFINTVPKNLKAFPWQMRNASEEFKKKLKFFAFLFLFLASHTPFSSLLFHFMFFPLLYFNSYPFYLAWPKRELKTLVVGREKDKKKEKNCGFQ